MASLYLARDPAIDRLVAIKVIREGFDDDELRARFAREARSVGRLRHPNIVTIFQFGEQDGQPFIVMEYIPGQTLEQLIRQRSPVPLARRLRLLVDLCAGLGYAHHAGIVHRDIKPANLIVGADDVLKILDFGIARLADSSMTHAGSVVGTFNYMSPEQVTGSHLDHRSDIFAAGAVAYELLSFQRAFPGDDPAAIFHRILHTEPEPLDAIAPDVGSDVVGVVKRALEKDLSRRYQDLAVMRRDLEDSARRLPESDTVLLESWQRTAAPTPQPPVTPPPRTPARSTDAAALARRRAAQIQATLDAARAALERGDHQGAILACEQTLILDPEHRAALDVLEQAQTEAFRAQEDAQSVEREALDRIIDSEPAPHADFDLPLARTFNLDAGPEPGAESDTAPHGSDVDAVRHAAGGHHARSIDWRSLFFNRWSVLIGGAAIAVLFAVAVLRFIGAAPQIRPAAPASARLSSPAHDRNAQPAATATTGRTRESLRQAPHTVAPPTGPPDLAPSTGAEGDHVRRPAELKKQASEQWQRGNREQALSAVSAALALGGDDKEMKTLIDGMLNEAIRRVATASRAAVDAGATAYADDLYSRARDDEAEGQRLSGERRPVAALRAYWKAADGFDAAAAAGREKRSAADTAAITEALDAYRAAYQNLDLDAIKRYRMPDAAQLADLEAAFKVAKAYRVEMSTPSIVIDGDAASASCEVVYRLTTKSEDTPYVERQVNVFRLQRRGSAWAIVGVDVRERR